MFIKYSSGLREEVKFKRNVSHGKYFIIDKIFVQTPKFNEF